MIVTSSSPLRRGFSGEDRVPVTVDPSREQLEALVNQRLDSRLLPVILDFLYEDPMRAGMMPPLIRIATADKVGELRKRCDRYSANA